ncbi:MAG: nicotinate-nucleotide--dimethylbenzimidazole phosphoribosyltransferase, partial [Oceanospirillaceae bacterium]|nr:nicotinate-nucleotide--dimethylbenzimidazole phosphoribosyltransferase [Oceanospirillaceae bacterium]
MNFDWINQHLSQLNQTAQTEGLDRQGQLTKPPGSLGSLEAIAVRLCAMQGTGTPSVDNAQVVVFA